MTPNAANAPTHFENAETIATLLTALAQRDALIAAQAQNLKQARDDAKQIAKFAWHMPFCMGPGRGICNCGFEQTWDAHRAALEGVTD